MFEDVLWTNLNMRLIIHYSVSFLNRAFYYIVYTVGSLIKNSCLLTWEQIQTQHWYPHQRKKHTLSSQNREMHVKGVHEYRVDTFQHLNALGALLHILEEDLEAFLPRKLKIKNRFCSYEISKHNYINLKFLNISYLLFKNFFLFISLYIYKIQLLY